MTEHANLAAALVAALADVTVVDKAREAKTGSYSYKYADIADVVKVTRPALAAQGVVALTPVHEHGTGLACTVVLLHTSGDRLDFGPFPFQHGKDAQATGSAVTYIRRYALVSALGMAAGDDDDGAAAQPRQAPPQAHQAPPLQKPAMCSTAGCLLNAGHGSDHYIESPEKAEAESVMEGADLAFPPSPSVDGMSRQQLVSALADAKQPTNGSIEALRVRLLAHVSGDPY